MLGVHPRGHRDARTDARNRFGRVAHRKMQPGWRSRLRPREVAAGILPLGQLNGARVSREGCDYPNRCKRAWFAIEDLATASRHFAPGVSRQCPERCVTRGTCDSASYTRLTPITPAEPRYLRMVFVYYRETPLESVCRTIAGHALCRVRRCNAQKGVTRKEMEGCQPLVLTGMLQCGNRSP